MKNLLLLLVISPLLVFAKTVKPKVMHGIDRDNHRDHDRYYSRSSHHRDKRDTVLSSTVEASGEITITISFQISTEASTEITSGGGHHSNARLSYLDNNRVQITEDIAKGEGEYLETLLNMMNLPKDEASLKKIQDNFDELIYLSHNDFLDKLESLV